MVGVCILYIYYHISYETQFCHQEARATFRQLLCESTVRIDNLAKKLGACVDKARPYYEARMKSKEVIRNTTLSQ
jgi:hypothetical protein